MVIMEGSRCTLSSSEKNNENSQELYQKHDIINEEPGYKCGEAYYVSSRGEINVRCTLCGIYFEYGNENYLKHIINDHFNSYMLAEINESREYHLSINQENLGETKVDVEANIILKSNCVTNRTLKKRNCLEELEQLKGETPPKKRKFGRKRLKVEKEKRNDLNSEEFNNKYSLLNHQKGHINDLKAGDGLICEQCGRKFARKNTLESHFEIAHNPNRKLFPCNECEKSFTTSEALVAHNRHYHTKELPYICEVENCNKRYASQKGLKYHQAKHSNTTFSCSECNKQYSHKNKLQIHFKRHHSVGKTYHCGQCDKSFYGSYFLKKHMICHTNERPFLCDQCPANFPRQKALVAHKKIHSGMRDEVCKLCGQAFNLYEGLYQHMRIRHGIKYYRAMTLQDMQIKEKESLKANS